MKSTYGNILQTTIPGLEDGLLVRHIATFDLKTCEAAEEVTMILSSPAMKDFDQIPVRDNGQIVGVLERKEETISGSVRKHMRSLSDSILVSAEMPLTKFVPLMAAAQYRLVLSNAEIQGIVTRSDIPKLPVRLFAFALVTHLEMVMADLIRVRYPNEQDWLPFLSPGRKEKLEKKLHDLRRENLNLSMLELTEFCDKRTIVKEACKLGSPFEDELKAIEKLRNTLSHAGDYAQNGEELKIFVERLRQAEYWIGQLSKDLGLPSKERK